LATTIRYDRARPVVVLAPILEVNGDTMPSTLQYDVADPGSRRVSSASWAGTVHGAVHRPRHGNARANSRRTRAVILDDSVFALYVFAAWRAGAEPGSLTAIFPRGLRRDVVQIRDLGLAPTVLNRTLPACGHITLERGRRRCTSGWMRAAVS